MKFRRKNQVSDVAVSWLVSFVGETLFGYLAENFQFLISFRSYGKSGRHRKCQANTVRVVSIRVGRASHDNNATLNLNRPKSKELKPRKCSVCEVFAQLLRPILATYYKESGTMPQKQLSYSTKIQKLLNIFFDATLNFACGVNMHEVSNLTALESFRHCLYLRYHLNIQKRLVHEHLHYIFLHIIILETINE